MDYQIVAQDLRFPEGPIWMQDGSVIVVEIAAGRLTRITSNGDKQTIAEPGGGPNGAAIGPDGRVYLCNNGGFSWTEHNGLLFPGRQPRDYSGGRIETVDIGTGRVERLYDSCDGIPLKGPNDIVFDDRGGFYFTDCGKSREHDVDLGGVFYARADGSSIHAIARGLLQPNGCGLCPDGKTLYVSLTSERLLLAFDLEGDGQAAASWPKPGRVVTSFPGRQWLDSLAVTADGHVCVAALVENPGIVSVDPVTGKTTSFLLPDPVTTNICFGGHDMKDAWITLSASGKLIRTRWDRPGLRLAHYA
ncbi:SMP-30/gluconolactonase/LRE family protein [Pseudomonas sp. NPDC089569]|uniref:SMP-30/gluconolactonase/LRE family protein n=1 Tax=Pseudomonas sp. NPDC089569 TaxID=3390722 RepID=UPI003D05C11C